MTLHQAEPLPARDHAAEWLEALRSGDRDRFLCVLAAPQHLRADLAALYAFNLEIAGIADKVSEPMLALIRLQWWRDALAETGAGHAHRHPLVQALGDLRHKGLDLSLLHALLAGREGDCERDPPHDLAALEAYAESTAGLLAEAAVTLSVVDADPDLRRAARRSGTGYGLTGLLRATPHLARRGIVRLPADAMQRAGLSPDRLRDLRRDSTLPQVVAEVAARAGILLAESRTLPATARRRAIAAFLPGRLALAQLERLRRHGYDPFVPAAIAGSGLDIWRLLIARWTGRV